MSWMDWLKSKVTSSMETDPEAMPAGENREDSWTVTITDARVSCARPGGMVESVEWDDLKEVVIVTNDEGPFAIDVMWLLIGDESGCVVPLGVTGEDALIERLQALPGFDNEVMIEAMGSTNNRRFVCWERKESGDRRASGRAEFD